jgi:hypothetical protein
MKNGAFRYKILPPLAVILGGLLSILLVYATYFAVYMIIEGLFYDDVTQTPTDIIRFYTCLGLCLAWVLVSRLRIPDMAKAAMGVGPLTMLMVVIFFNIYQTPGWALLATTGVGLVAALFVFMYKKPWFYYVVPALALIISTWYSWPR